MFGRKYFWLNSLVVLVVFLGEREALFAAKTPVALLNVSEIARFEER